MNFLEQTEVCAVFPCESPVPFSCVLVVMLRGRLPYVFETMSTGRGKGSRVWAGVNRRWLWVVLL